MMMASRDPAIKLFGMKIQFPAVVDEEEVMEWSDRDGGEDKSTEKVLIDSQEETDINDSPETIDAKTLKKPTKILPCPRCKSMDTKFCYYNNYNINQPRHFCKACQRYWTSGGTMRNVPVGAGRRKNKTSESLEAARLNQGLQGSSRILNFSLEALQHHAAHMMKLQGDHKFSNGAPNRLPEQRLVDGDDCSSGSVVITSNNHSVDDESRPQSYRVVEPQINNTNNINGYACIPGVPWPYTWNPPGFYPHPVYPIPFYPYWTIPFLSPHQSSLPTSQKGPNPNSPTLGKHSRDEESVRKENETEHKQRSGSVLVPKTLRIDDPNEAAKSSIWTTLGIKNEGISKGGMFKGFDQKTKKNINDKAENSSVLSANPAAFSRSLNFHEQN